MGFNSGFKGLIIFLQKENLEQPGNRLLKREFFLNLMIRLTLRIVQIPAMVRKCISPKYSKNQNFEYRYIFKSPWLILRSRRQIHDEIDALIYMYSPNLIICVDFIWYSKSQSTNFNPLYYSQKKTLKINPLYAFILNTHHPETKKVEFNEVKSRYYHHNEIHQVTVEL